VSRVRGRVDHANPYCRKDIVVAAGLHKAIATEYFRIGHMGVTAVDPSRGDVDKVLDGIKSVLSAKGWSKD
jgi:alanine-glyoxylate transaminase/serine-glyoxylate transaminase/serine-pyruvate transaminase